MTESADKVFTNSVRKQSRRGSSWVHPAPHTNDPHIVNRILSPRSKVRRELMSNYSSREIVRSPGEAPTTNSSSPTSDFLIKGKSTFSCPVRIYPVNGSFTRSDDDAGIVTVSHDKKKIYCPTKSMREVTSFEFDDVSDRTTTNAEFFDQSIAPCLDSVWQGGRSTVVLCGSAKRGSDIMAEGDSSNLNRIGFIHMASANFFSRRAQLLQSLGNDNESSSYYSVRISWYEIRGHKIVDLLAAAASAARAQNDVKGNSFAAQEELLLHEGKGNYVEVSDLLEVEVTCAGDVRKVVNSVRERLKRRRKFAHSVFNISVGTVDGLLTIATLGSIKTNDGNQSEWVKDLQQTLETLRAKSLKSRLSKYHFRSNAMLLLRDGLTRRTDFTFIPCITGDIDDAEETLEILILGANVRDTLINGINAKIMTSPSATIKSKNRNAMSNPIRKRFSPQKRFNNDNIPSTSKGKVGSRRKPYLQTPGANSSVSGSNDGASPPSIPFVAESKNSKSVNNRSRRDGDTQYSGSKLVAGKGKTYL